MPLIKQPNEVNSTGPLAIGIYGEPGTGKSTLALSAPNPVMIDADNGMKRVQMKWRKPFLTVVSYQDIRDLVDGNELNDYDTIIIDTLGKLIDQIADWIMSKNPKARKADGSLALQGFGAMRNEFARLVRDIKRKGKHFIVVAHSKEESDGDNTRVRLDVTGSSGRELIKDLDCLGYIEMIGAGRRTISFSPTEKFYAKNSLGLPNHIDLPNPEKSGVNDFVQKQIIERAQERQAQDAAENDRYAKVIKALANVVETVKDAISANKALDVINQDIPIWDSIRRAKAMLAERTAQLGITYDKEAKAFRDAPKQDKAVPVEPVAETSEFGTPNPIERKKAGQS